MSETACIEYAAEAMHCSLQVARKMAKAGKIAGVFRVAGTRRWLIHKATFDRWLIDLQATPEMVSIPPVEAPAQGFPRLEPGTMKLLGPKATARLKVEMMLSRRR